MKGNIPLYQKIFNELEKEILEGLYSEGDLFPSEKELQNKYGVSRITVRKSMEMLQNEGYIEKFSGLGTIVKNNSKIIKLRSTAGFSRDNQRYNASSKLITFERILPSAKIQVRLNLNPKEYVYKIERLRFIENEVVGLHTSFVPVKLMKLEKEFFEDEHSSLYSFFEENDIKIDSADETIEVKIGNELVNSLLKVPLDFPSLYLERITFNELEEPIEYVQIYYRTDRYKYQTKFHNYTQ